MNDIIQNFSQCIKKYADFDGRASRSEYWYFVLFQFLINIGIGVLCIAAVSMATLSHISPSLLSASSLILLGGLLVFDVVLLIPHIAVQCRRLHDIGMSGWLMLLSLIPLIGAITLLVLYCQDSQPGTNMYGPNPKQEMPMPYQNPFG